MLFRIGTKEDYPKMKEVFFQCFGDEDAYINFFYEETEEKVKHYLLLEGDEILSMVTLFPFTLKGEVAKEGGYIYGVATPTSHRKKGYMKILFHHLDQLTPYDFYCLVPAQPYLFQVYASVGYGVSSYLGEVDDSFFSERDRSLLDIPEKISLTEYFLRRQEYLQQQTCYGVFSQEEYLQKELSFTGCKGIAFMGNYFLYYKAEEKGKKILVIRESLLFFPEHLQQIGVLKDYFFCEEIKVRCHSGYGTSIPYGMYKSKTGEVYPNFYMNLMLD